MTSTLADASPADRRADFLIRAGQVLASSLDHERTLKNVIELAVPVLADWCSIHLVDDNGAIRPVAFHGADKDSVPIGREWQERFAPLVSDRNGIGRVIREGVSTHVFDITPEALRDLLPPGSEQLAARTALRSVILVPMKGERGTIGCISLAMSVSGRRFGTADLALAQDLAHRASTAIENARLHHEVREQARRAACLSEVSRILGAPRRSEAMMRDVMGLLAPTLGAWGLAWSRAPDGSFTLAARVGPGAEAAGLVAAFPAKLQAGDGPLARVARSHDPRCVRVPLKDALAELGVTAYQADRGECLVAPVVANEDRLGLLLLAPPAAEGRARGASPLIEEVARRLGIAIDHALVHERLSGLHLVTSHLGAAHTTGQVAATLGTTAARVVGATTAVLAALDEEGKLRIVTPPGNAANPVSDRDRARALEEAMTKGGDFFVEREGGAGEEVRACAILPLRDGAKPLGVLAFEFDTVRHFTPSARAFLRAVADQSQQAIARVALAQAALVRHQLLESQNEAALDGIFFQDAEGRPAFFNRRLLEIFGVPADVPTLTRMEERLARSLASIADPAAFQALAMDMERRPQASLRFDLKLRDGRILDAYTTPVAGPDGSRLGRAWYYRDATDARRLQRELVEARLELSHREKLAALGSLVSGVAHEIRTPLAYAANHAHIIRSAGDSPDRRIQVEESAAAIVEAVERMNRLVQDLRRFTKTRGGAIAPAHAKEAALAAVRLFEATRPDRVKVAVEVLTDAHVAIERVQLQQVLLNLLENAADASPPGSPVGLRVRGVEGKVEFEVSDRGPGIPREVQERMWEPFFTTKPEGTGLGLSIVRRIAETHRGDVRCESSPGKGARFSVDFPIEEPAPADG